MDETLRKKYELSPEKLRYECDPKEFGFKTTKDLNVSLDSIIIGQEKAIKSIEHGLRMPDKHNNVFAAGPEGTGKNTVLKHQITKYVKSEDYKPIAKKRDVVAVYNFEYPDNPGLIAFSTGIGNKFVADLDKVIRDITTEGMDAYAQDVEKSLKELERTAGDINADYEKIRKKYKSRIIGLSDEAKALYAQIEEKVMLNKDSSAIKKLRKELQDKKEKLFPLERKMQEIGIEEEGQLRKLENQQPELQRILREDWKKKWIKPKIDLLRKEYPSQTLDTYLKNMGDDLGKNIEILMQGEFSKLVQRMNPSPIMFSMPDLDLSKYRAKLLLDATKIDGVPIVIEREPTLENLFGLVKNLEWRPEGKMERKNNQHLRLSLEKKTGSYMKAHGGYLILDAISVILNGSWGMLQKCVLNEETRVSDMFLNYFGNPVRSEPIKNKVKVILKGENWLYTLLSCEERSKLRGELMAVSKKDPSTPSELLNTNILEEYENDLEGLIRHVVNDKEDRPDVRFSSPVFDDNFKKLFKVKAEFDGSVKNDVKSREKYARFIAQFCEKEGLKHLTSEGVTEVIEKLARYTDSKNKLTLYVGDVENLIRESHKEALLTGSKEITEEHVRKSIKDERERHNLIEEKIQEYINDGTIMIDVEKELIGKINGLAVYDSRDLRFGAPTRITAVTSLGGSGEFISVDREAKMTGKIHDKAFSILEGNLERLFAEDKYIPLKIRLCFEQNYGGIDGDSATLAELLVTLSSLTKCPIDQGIAVTGSLNQHGEVQPIGGVNEKIEGFYDICKMQGLTSNQGVMIPKINVKDLMLKNEIIQDIETGKFHIYAIETAQEAVEVIFDLKAGFIARSKFEEGTLYHKADEKIKEMNKLKKEIGKKE